MAEIRALADAAAVLGWDQQTYMPPGGGEGRAQSLSALSRIVHDMGTGTDTETLLIDAEKDAGSLDPDSDDAAYLRVARREFNRAAKLPTALVAEITRVTTLGYETWHVARTENDYARFAPVLEQVVDLSRQVADLLGFAEQRYDALLDEYEPGMKASQVASMFAAVKPTLVKLVQAVAEQKKANSGILTRPYPESQQEAFGKQIVTAFGFDWTRGRQDRAVHPFCTSFTTGDVRITTRYEENFVPAGLFGSLHETGHALYEQNVAPRYDAGGVLGGGVSLGVHESQSRLWENLVGRSRPFWERYYGDLQTAFPDALNGVKLDDWYTAINRVEPSLIRVEADEVTYNLHILLRFEMEVELLEGRLSVADAPAAWNAKMQEYLGITPPTDAEGILQDVHWSSGLFGYFPTYSVGNLLSVQLFEAADKSLGGQLNAQIAAGNFDPLREWLTANVYQWGKKFDPAVLVQRATGCAPDPAPYLRYLNTKFGTLYGLSN